MTKIGFLALCVFFHWIEVQAQNNTNFSVTLIMPQVSRLDVEPSGVPILFTFQAPTEAGSALGNLPANTSKWLNFTSAVALNQRRSVRVQLSNPLPVGVTLQLTTSPVSGGGAGALGSVQSPLVLSTTAQTLLQDIGGAFTGNGINTGYRLNFSVQIPNYAQLRAQTATTSVIYTLTDN